MADKILKSLNFGGADRYFPLPLVTDADNDKILSVVNGEWAAAEAPSGGPSSGQYVWSKHESETGPIIEYVIGETEADYPDGGWSEGAYYARQKIGFKIIDQSDSTLKDAFIVTQGITWREFIDNNSTLEGFIWIFGNMVTTAYNGGSPLYDQSENVYSTDIIKSQEYYVINSMSGGGSN